MYFFQKEGEMYFLKYVLSTTEAQELARVILNYRDKLLKICSEKQVAAIEKHPVKITVHTGLESMILYIQQVQLLRSILEGEAIELPELPSEVKRVIIMKDSLRRGN